MAEKWNAILHTTHTRASHSSLDQNAKPIPRWGQQRVLLSPITSSLPYSALGIQSPFLDRLPVLDAAQS